MLFGILAILTVSFGVYTAVNAPSKLKKVEFLVESQRSLWREKILKDILPLVRPGVDLTPQFVESLKESIERLPWVERCKLEAKGSTLTIKVWEEKASFNLAFGGKIYVIGRNGFVLGITSRPEFQVPTFFFKGKNFPFLAENGFLRIKNSVKIMVELTRTRLKEIELEGYKPEITLLDTGVQLAFHKPPFLVYLGMEESEWEEFDKLFREKKLFRPGIYDLRYSQLLVVKGRRRECCPKSL